MKEIVFGQGAAISEIAMYRLQPAAPAAPIVTTTGFTTPQLKYYHNSSPWAYWGDNNQMPIDMALKIGKSGVLTSSLEGNTRMAIGKGIRPVIITGINKEGTEEMEFIHDPEIEDWLEMSNDFSQSITSIFDMLGFGWCHSRLIMSNDLKKVARYQSDDVVNCRLGKKNVIGIIDKTFIAADWQWIYGQDKPDAFVKDITCLEENNEYNDLVEILASGSKQMEYSFISRRPIRLGRNYYPYPAWYSVYDWVNLTILVPAMKIAMFNNQATIKYLITINEKYFTRMDPKFSSYTGERKQEIFNAKVADINKHLTGNDNAYKSISVGGYTDVSGKLVADISIEVLDDKVKEGKLLPDSAAGDKQILFANMTNPAIVGANVSSDGSGGAGSGSDIREAYLVQIMMREYERRMNAKIFNIAKRINGWTAKYPGKNLQFRYPSLILTTLDTGGSTASTVAPPAPGAPNQKTVANAPV